MLLLLTRELLLLRLLLGLAGELLLLLRCASSKLRLWLPRELTRHGTARHSAGRTVQHGATRRAGHAWSGHARSGAHALWLLLGQLLLLTGEPTGLLRHG